MKKKLPIGIESFKEIRKEGFYYVDKTGFIRDLLHFGSKVSLFTRPRRFGKSLNMDMLKAFFEIGTDVSLFEGLEISKEEELCDKYMGVFPVISVSLKSVEGTTFEDAKDMLESVVRFEANRFSWLMDSDRLTKYDKLQFEKLLLGDFSKISYLADSFKLLTLLLYKHYDRKVIVLIDEYDVPLEKAYSNGYYPEMTNIIRLLFGGVLKTNDCLKFAVVTGCLRISKESIFTGLNNFIVFTTVDTAYARYFGFTSNEVKEMLEYYDMNALYSTVKEWYDGYLFGNINVYCPWDVVNYIQEHLADIEAPAKMYWIGTSENTIVKMLIKRANSAMKDEIEQLIEGKSINKEIRTELTYQDLDESQSDKSDTGKDNLWSLLFTTGYLTMLKRPKDAKNYDLIIPNKEIKNIFITQISNWINNTVILGNTVRLERFYKAVRDGSAKDVEDIFNQYIMDP